MSGETLEVEVNELTKGLQDIQKDIEDVSDDDIPGDMFRQVMTVSFHSYNHANLGITKQLLGYNSGGVGHSIQLCI